MSYNLILASSSPSRLSLLQDIGITPDQIIKPDVDETLLPKEKPRGYCIRIAEKKLNAAAKLTSGLHIIIAADTTSICRSKVLHKAENDEQVRHHIEILSGRRHAVYTAVFCALVDNGEIIKKTSRLVKSIVQFKRLTKDEINYLVACGQGIGKCGGCQIAKSGARYVKFVSGSPSNIAGLPQYEISQMLSSLGYQLNRI